uniref:Uncharacterized protein n=1 Tax=Clytia hemisphaerica TaxID=252671 RepID=A0A7M5VFA1_9CNID|eukprot:TCONS_00000035-protein
MENNKGNADNTYGLSLFFKQEVGFKAIHCTIIRILDNTEGTTSQYEIRPDYIGAEKIEKNISMEFISTNYLNMGHDYTLDCMLNVNWCSLDVNDGQAKVRSGDFKSTEWTSVSGRSRTGKWLNYKLKINMEDIA